MIFLILGVLFVLIPIALFVAGKMNETEFLHWKWKLTIAIVGVFLISFESFFFFYAEPGYSYAVQYLTGTQVSVLSPGYHLKLGGEVIPFKKVITITGTNEDKNASGVVEPIKVIFNDAVKADVSFTTRFRLPEDPELFLHLALDFRSQENFIIGALIPTNREMIRNSARLISAQEYISGKGGEFEQAIQDQLDNGMYILETKEIKEYTKSDSLVKDNQQRSVAKNQVIKYEVSPKTDSKNEIMRKRHPLSGYGVSISQSSISLVDTEDKFDQQLAQQRDAAAQASVQKQKAKAAEYEKQKVIAEGETQKATIQVEKEKEQISTLVEAETQLKAAKINKEKEKALLEAAEIEAKRIVALGKAEADKKRLIQQADGSIIKKMELDAQVQINKCWAESFKAITWPSVLLNGGANQQTGSPVDFMELMRTNAAIDLKSKVKK